MRGLPARQKTFASQRQRPEWLSGQPIDIASWYYFWIEVRSFYNVSCADRMRRITAGACETCGPLGTLGGRKLCSCRCRRTGWLPLFVIITEPHAKVRLTRGVFQVSLLVDISPQQTWDPLGA